MSNRSGVVSVDIEPNLAGAGSKIDAWSRGLQPIGLKVDVDAANLTAVGAGAAVVGTKILGSLRPAIDAASDLNEAISYSTQVFGSQAKAIETFGDSAAASIGQSKREAIEGATTFAAFGKAAGLADRDLVGFSTSLVKLASDLASARNTSPEEAITAIGAALRGESEPIRRYGVLLDDASVRQEALALGITKTTKEALTPQQKVLAVNSLLFKQTADSQGDFARTADGLANSQRIANAEFENAKAKLGDDLAPVLATATKTAASFVEVLDKIPGGTTALGVAIAGIGGAAILGGAITSIVGAGKALASLRSDAASTGTAMAEAGATGNTAFTSLSTGGILAATVAVIGFTTAIQENERQFDDYIGKIGSSNNLTASAFDPKNVGRFSTAVNTAAADLAKLNEVGASSAVDKIKDFFGLYGDGEENANRAAVQSERLKTLKADLASLPVDQARAGLDAVRDRMILFGTSSQDADALLKELYRELEDRESTTSFSSGVDQIGGLLDQFGFAIDKNKSKLQQYGASLVSAFDPIQAAIDAQNAVEDGQRSIAAAQKKLNDILSGNTEGLRSAAESLRSAREDLNKAVAETGPGSRAAEDAAMTLHDALKALHDAQIEAGKQPNGGDFFEDRRQQIADAEIKVRRAREDLAKIESGNSDQVISARERVTEAQRRYNEELSKTGPHSQAARDAQEELNDAEARMPGLLVAAEAAAASLQDELEQHPEAIQAAINKIDEWTAQGKISTETARLWKEELLQAAAAAAQLNGAALSAPTGGVAGGRGNAAGARPQPDQPRSPTNLTDTSGPPTTMDLPAFKARVRSRRLIVSPDMKFKGVTRDELAFVRDLESRRDLGAFVDMLKFFDRRGGYIGGYARGGLVGGSGSGDIVPAMLEPGEIVMRKSAVQQYGAANLLAANDGQPITITPTTSGQHSSAELIAEIRALRGDLVSTVRYLARMASPGAGEELGPVLRAIESNTREGRTSRSLAQFRAGKAEFG